MQNIENSVLNNLNKIMENEDEKEKRIFRWKNYLL
jgi:hypothetical protein